ncbi:ergothioneine biosynthesis protein EgtB [Falsibacillus albus]|uniref:Ergothioneine biosynthesis protein EgtB n=1 Tax=Falsibacillus albus TaxID=2478915 RepID=A0A3L7K113_9BACI|nr:ergothioneine biosynthesis protein EgtB [Falsibacillus albus]RLQ96758.1 ergothioneine biosynthesis protein EgtB [Falsibacillus albus]
MSVQDKVSSIAERYKNIRSLTEKIVYPLETEDYMVQASPDASPPKWHLAHTTWFFEKFILKSYLSQYKELNPHFDYLFNSYYETVGAFHPRHSRGNLARPTVKEVISYRHHVDEHMQKLIGQMNPEEHTDLKDLIEIGLNHEQQHQELLLTDIKFNFSQNPILPTFIKDKDKEKDETETIPYQESTTVEMEGGLVEIGHSGDVFAFDNEGPRHKVWLNPYTLSSHPVMNVEFMEFIADGGYERPELWLSEGWEHVQKEGWNAPLYWKKHGDEWHYFTLTGERKVEKYEPVCHVSFYEADAFARWAGKRLPTEAEWEHAFELVKVDGNFLEKEMMHPTWEDISIHGPFNKVYGDVWEWTSSAYSPYPGSKPLEGALGEYNAKFMCNQMVLKGGSCATPMSHMRATYRNFFQPEKRWQFSGFRLAGDL